MPIVSLLTSLRSRLLSSTAIDAYAAGGFNPSLVLDFDDEYYRTSGSTSTFSDSITHSATTNATMVDSDGLLKWRPHNLLAYSEQFDSAAWTKSNVTITANAAVSPDGTTTADKLVESATTAEHLIYSGSLVSGQKYTLRYFAKAAERSLLLIRMNVQTLGWVNTTFNLATGELGTVGTGHSATITDVGSGWYLCGITFINGSSFGFSANIAATDNTQSYAGDGTSGIYIWGAHVYRSDLGGMVDNPDRGDSYVPTTTSAVYLPRRGHHVYNGTAWVNEGLLHESEARTNLVTYSEDFTQWTPVAISLATDETGPDGVTNSATTITASGTPSYLYTPAATTAGTSTASLFVKEGTASVVWLYCESTVTGGAAYFDLSDESVQAVAGSGQTPTNLQIQKVGTFYRVSASWVVTTGTTNFGFGSANVKGSVTTTSGKSFIVYGAQLEAGSTLSSYIPTAGATVTRAAETLTVPAANLPWPSPVVIGEELVTNGTFDTDTTGWVTSGGGASIVWSSGSMLVTASAPFEGAIQTLPLTAGKVYLLSCDYVRGTSPAVRLAAQGFSGQPTAAGTAASGTLQVVAVASINNLVRLDIGGSGSGDFYVDNISVREINPLSVSIQMQGRMTYADTDSGNEVRWLQWGAGADPTISAYLRTTASRTGDPLWQQIDTVATSLDGPDTAYSPGVNVPFNIASRHGSTFINGAVDGVALTADTTPTALPDLSSTDLNLGHDMMGTIKLFRMWSDDLADEWIEIASGAPIILGVPTIGVS